MSRYPTGNELKKEIRKAVPALGHRDLSVKYSGSYDVNVKKVVPLSKVEAVAGQCESYSRCEASGEILSGGNTFVFVKYCRWDTNKDEPFTIEVPEEFVNAALTTINNHNLGESFDAAARFRFLSEYVKKENVELFEEYNESDVRAVLGLVQESSDEVSSWISEG